MNKIAHTISLTLLCQMALADDEKCNIEQNPDCQQKVQNNKQLASQLSTISVTANRMETGIAKYAGQISILEEKEFQNSENIVHDLAMTPGIQIGADWGRMIGSNFRIRGFGYQEESRVIIEQDGVKRSPSLFSNHISSFRVDTGLLKRVEVVKGSSSILHGGGAIGGIVSMKTKEARDYIKDEKNIGFAIGARAETNNLKSGHIAFAVDPQNIPVDFLIYGKKTKIDDLAMAGGGVEGRNGIIDKAFNDESIDVGFIKVGYDITSDMRASLSFYNYKEKLDTVLQTLYHNYDFSNDNFTRKGKLKQKDLVIDFSYIPDNNQLINFSVKAYKSDASYYRKWASQSQPQIYNNYYDNQDSRWGISLKNASLFNTGSVEHQLVSGFEYENRNEDAIFFTGSTFADFGSFPNYYKDLGIYVQDNMSFGIVDVTIGGRYDSFKRGVNKEGNKGYSGSHFSPKVAVAVEVTNGVNLLAGYAETFRGPMPSETSSAGALNPHYYYLPNQELKPETAKEIEAGFSIDKNSIFTSDDSLHLKATYFTAKIDDMISIKTLPDLGPPPQSSVFAQYRNVRDARRKGVEVEGSYNVNNWSFNIGYDHIKLFDKKTGKRINYFADKMSVQAGYFYEPWGLNVGVQAVHWFRPKLDEPTFTDRWGTYTYSNRTFTIVNLKGQWAPKNTGASFLDDGFKLKFGVNNVFDDKYMRAGSTETSTKVGKGRNAYLEFEKQF